jgi:hypothetical protein
MTYFPARLPSSGRGLLRESLVKREGARKVAPHSVGVELSASIWWPLAVKLWC